MTCVAKSKWKKFEKLIDKLINKTGDITSSKKVYISL